MKDTIKAVLFGRTIAKRILTSYPDSTIVFTTQNIGDQCVALSYVGEYKKQNGRRIVYLTENPDSAVVKYFKNQIDEVASISHSDMNALLKFYKSDLGQFFREKEDRLLCVFGTAYVRNDLIRECRNLDFIRIEKAIYRISEDSKPCGIDKNLIDYSIIDKYTSAIDEKNTVIINPYANSCKGVPISFFDAIAEKLSAAGMCIISSVYGDQRPVSSSEGLQFSMLEAVPLFEKCGFIVGARSGFLDLAAQSSAVIASIDCDAYQYSDFYRIEAWNRDQYLRSFRWKNEKEEQIVDDVVDYILKAKERL